MKAISNSFASLVALFTVVYVVTAADVPVCTNGQSQWVFNSLGQSPCQVSSYLSSVCTITGTNGDIPTLGEGQYYIAGSAMYANACWCSTVFYSLLSACAICQSGIYRSWSYYSANCSIPIRSLGSFPADIPSGTRVPHWAYLDVVSLDMFSAFTAQNNLDAPESTAVRQQSVTASYAGFTTGLSGSTAPAQSSGAKKSNTGAIAGGVVGAIVFIILIVGLVFWLTQRRRKSLGTPNAVAAPSNPPTSTYVDYNPVSIYPSAPNPSSHKPYDPSDPLTYPSSSLAPSSTLNTPSQGSTPPLPIAQNPSTVGTQVPMQGPNRYPMAGQGHGYSGAPEV